MTGNRSHSLDDGGKVAFKVRSVWAAADGRPESEYLGSLFPFEMPAKRRNRSAGGLSLVAFHCYQSYTEYR